MQGYLNINFITAGNISWEIAVRDHHGSISSEEIEEKFQFVWIINKSQSEGSTGFIENMKAG